MEGGKVAKWKILCGKKKKEKKERKKLLGQREGRIEVFLSL